ncbi:N-6 DNA methylase [Microvirga arabica]|uniref:site-specific DNA-methyltransferase (adenine-specific) n=1 Tax=Microvirga arabica TaxID=1128671 RepID=A0ABV6YHA9_9HYPH
MTNSITATLRAIRSALGFSQEQLADRLGVSFATVNRWEGGTNTPQKAAREVIAALAREAGIDSGESSTPADAAAAVTRRRRGATAPSTKSMEQMLWDAACSIRGEKDAAKFKDYLLPLLFLKRLSDVFDDEITRLAEEYGDSDTALEIAESDHDLLRFYLPPEARWAVISGREQYNWPNDDQGRSTRPKDIGEHLTKAARAVVRQNPSLSGVIDAVDFAAERNGERDINPAKLREVVETFSDPRYRLGLADVQPDFLGRAYEYLLRKFAEGSGQSAGEFFTPTEVGFLMAHIMRPKPGEECHDYACGSAGLLVKLQLVARELDPTSKVPLKLYGQELTAESYAVAQMNAIIHDMDVEIARGDTMINPKFKTSDSKIRTYDIVVANPMWNQPFNPDIFADDPFDRFRTQGGVTSGKGDWAWLQHTVTCLNDHGRAAVVLDTGAMTRGSGSKNEDRERNIRKWFVDQDLIEGVILLPPNLFYNTPASGIIVILNKRKASNRKGKILLFKANRFVLKGKPKNYLPVDAIRHIASAFHKGEPIAGELAVISCEQVVEADYNLSPARWVRNETATHQHCISSLASQIDAISEKDRLVTDSITGQIRSVEQQANDHSLKAGEVIIKPEPLSNYIERPEYGFTESATSAEVGPRFLRITDIQDGHVDWAQVPFCTCDDRTLEQKRLMPGDIVVARIGATTGKSYYVEACPNAVFASYLIRLRARPAKIIPKYLYYLLQTKSYWDHIDQNKGDRLKGGVNIPVLESFMVQVPSIDEQQKALEILDLIEQKKQLLREAKLAIEATSEALLDTLIPVVLPYDEEPEELEASLDQNLEAAQ